MNTAWLMLIIAGLLEVGWSIGLKYTDGFNFKARPLACTATLAAMVVSMWMLSLAVRTIPIGTGYAIWTGIGALGAATLGMILFHEPATAGRIFFLLMLVAGIIGLKLTSPSTDAAAPTTQPETQPQPAMTLYIGTYGQGIYRVTLDPTAGALSEPALVAAMKNASFLAIHPTLPVLYAVSEVGDFIGGKTGGVLAFRIEKDGTLAQLSARASGGDGPCFVSVDPSGRVALVANYGGGTVASLPIGADGSLGEPATIDQHVGSSVHPQRQTRAYAHSIIADPTGTFALSADLGMDKVLIYKLDAARGTLSRHAETSLPPGAGPRHIAFNREGTRIYVVNELSNDVASFDWDGRSGELRALQRIRTLPDNFAGQNTTAEIALHPTGGFVYASNRGGDSISGFRVDAATGQLDTSPARTKTGGKSPRHFAIDPSGQFMVVANQKSDMLAVFRIDGTTGAIAPAGASVTIAAPCCVRFAR